jgi:peptidyl-prolyl cis-trans isomerase SurA
MKDGELSQVMETAGGFHIIRRDGSRSGGERKTVEETHARHILIPVNALMNDQQAQLQARDIYDRLGKGEDFAKLAGEFSEDPGSKNAGGDLGWQPPGTFAPEFQTRIDALKPGDMTTPFRTQYGWHVAQVLERRTRDVTEDAKRARARSAVQNRKGAEEYDTWLRRLRDEAYVEFRTDKPEAAKS